MKIAILITTFLRDELLYKSVNSILSLNLNDVMILIADQGEVSDEKAKWYLETKNKYSESFHFRQLPFDCGLSVARNRLVDLAKEKNCEYCLLASDSFLCNSSLRKLEHFISMDLYGYDNIAFELEGCKVSWEARLELIKGECFELSFIEKDMKFSSVHNFGLYKCDIARNFFLAKTMSLYNTRWDENLRLGEHEDFFYRYKLNGYFLGWTDLISAEKMTDRPTEYANYRRKNFSEGLEALKNKWKIKSWVRYVNLERAKKA